MRKPKTLRVNSVKYRQGFIEITPNIHENHINIEAWNVDPGLDISSTELSSSKISDYDIIGNIEIELTINDAKKLISLLSNAIEQV